MDQSALSPFPTAPDDMPAVRWELAAVWAEVLGHHGFGHDDDFFEIGGDSIAALRLLLEVETAFEIRLQPDALIEHATIARMAALIARPRRAVASSALDGLEARLQTLIANWDGQTVADDGLLRGLNRQGCELPSFWCLQEGGELAQLAGILGADHPVYAMRSGHLLMAYTPEHTGWLARRYIREILVANPSGPYIIGGVCQGSIVALEIARQLQAGGHSVALLALIDTALWDLFKGRPYPGKAICLAGSRSTYNPLRRFRAPELGWRKLFPAGIRFALLPADHFELFSVPSAPALQDALRSAFDWSVRDEAATPCTVVGAMPASAYAAQYGTPKPSSMRGGECRHLVIRVRNTGLVPWHPDAGLALGNHWLRPDGELAVWADGRTALPHTLQPGESCDLALAVCAPAAAGRYLLEFDMVEEGVCWFKQRACATGFSEIHVRPGLTARLSQALRRPRRV